MSLWEQRAAENEALFRAVNERMQDLQDDRSDVSVHLVCECGDYGCTERLTVPVMTF